MLQDNRVWNVTRILSEYVRSPSLRHLRDHHALGKVAGEIVRCIDRLGAAWEKWEGERETWAQKALPCWIPMDDLRDFLNRLPGSNLTTTDVAARLDAMEHEDSIANRIEELREGCLAIYVREKAAGTEMPAIIWTLDGHVTREEQKHFEQEREGYRRRIEQAKQDAEQRLLSGADCRWTQMRGSRRWYCRVNGRLYRLSSLPDRRLQLCRMKAVSDEEPGAELGRYQTRGDATTAVGAMAYKPEPRW